MSTELELKKVRKKREPANYVVVIRENEAVMVFRTHKSAIRFINEQFNPSDYSLKENDIVKVIKQVERVVSTHSIQPVISLKASQLDTDLI